MGWVQAARVRLAVVAAVTASGCEVLFPFDGDDPTTVDAPAPIADSPPGPTDGSPPPADGGGPCPAGGAASIVAVTAEADATISSSSPSTPLGTNGVVNIGVGIQSRGMFRFPIPPEVDTPPLELRLLLPYAANQNDCGLGCGSCSSIDASGTLRVHAASSAWSETAVTWYQRQAGVAWFTPGADAEGVPGAADRGGVATFVAHGHAQDTAVPLTGGALAEAWMWLSPPLATRKLTLLVVPADSAVMVATSVEGALSPCEPDDVPARLAITYCP